MANAREAALVGALRALTEAAEELVHLAGAQGLPSGHLYAQLMPYGCSEEVYNGIIAMLVQRGVLRRSNSHVLYSVKRLPGVTRG